MIVDNYYSILGVDITSTINEIKKAYLTLAHIYHPDHNKGNLESTEKFLKIKNAYEKLKDVSFRINYDKSLAKEINFIKLTDEYKNVINTKCIPFKTQFKNKQEVGSLFRFKAFNITPGMVIDLYENVFCFMSGKYDDK
jgi:DnaJ-class molecular chaperone